jgi:hypothetical protein
MRGRDTSVKTLRFVLVLSAMVFPVALASCGGFGNSGTTLPSQPGVNVVLRPDSAKIVIKPKVLSFDALGASAAKTVTVTDKGYDGKLKESGTCRGIVALSPKTGKGPSFKLKVTPESNGVCSVTLKDSKGNKAELKVTVAAATPSPTVSPTATPSAVPTLSPTPIPPTPTPSPTPAPVTAKPGTVAICPSSGTGACGDDSAVITVSQSGHTGNFGESDNCLATVAKVTLASTLGSTSKFDVTGESTTGNCTATFTGSGGQQNSVSIKVEANGVIINERKGRSIR